MKLSGGRSSEKWTRYGKERLMQGTPTAHDAGDTCRLRNFTRIETLREELNFTAKNVAMRLRITDMNLSGKTSGKILKKAHEFVK